MVELFYAKYKRAKVNSLPDNIKNKVNVLNKKDKGQQQRERTYTKWSPTRKLSRKYSSKESNQTNPKHYKNSSSKLKYKKLQHSGPRILQILH